MLVCNLDPGCTQIQWQVLVIRGMQVSTSHEVFTLLPLNLERNRAIAIQLQPTSCFPVSEFVQAKTKNRELDAVSLTWWAKS